MSAGSPPLVLHVVYRFDVGGLENGVVNLINHMPAQRYRHAVLAVDGVVDSFARRVQRADVEFHSLHKPPGHALRQYPRLWRLFRQLRPAIVHSRNLAALETQIPAWAAGVPVRIHGEHGRDLGDLDGSSKRYQRLRRAYRPFIHHYVALSRDLQDYLTASVGIPAARVTQIYNGVDTRRFHPADAGRAIPAGSPFADPSLWLIGTVGRMQVVKDQTLLARAFVRALTLQPDLRSWLRLVMVGDGPLLAAVRGILAESGLEALAWLPGERQDVPDILRGLDCFALPSLAEGISNTILEAMASGLPIVATDVGGNADLVAPGEGGLIVPPSDVQAMASALIELAQDRARARAMGQAGRRRVEGRFSLDSMVRSYLALYDRALGACGTATRSAD